MIKSVQEINSTDTSLTTEVVCNCYFWFTQSMWGWAVAATVSPAVWDQSGDLRLKSIKIWRWTVNLAFLWTEDWVNLLFFFLGFQYIAGGQSIWPELILNVAMLQSWLPAYWVRMRGMLRRSHWESWGLEPRRTSWVGCVRYLVQLLYLKGRRILLVRADLAAKYWRLSDIKIWHGRDAVQRRPFGQPRWVATPYILLVLS